MLQVTWVVLGVVVVWAGVRSRADLGALRVGRYALAALYLGAGALVNAVFVLRGDDYADFASGSYLPFVRDTWESLVVPNHHFFIGVLLVGFEAAVGVLALLGGRRAVLALVGAIGFHVALLSFGWGFFLWSVPMLVGLSLLLSAQLRELHEAEAVVPVPVLSRR